MVASPTGVVAETTSLLSIPLKYTHLVKPVSNESNRQHVLFETSLSDKSKNIWRSLGDGDSYENFKQIIEEGAQFTDNLSSLRAVTSSIMEEGQVQADLVETRLLENTLTVNLSGPSQLAAAERARVLRSYHQVHRRHIGIDEKIINILELPKSALPEGDFSVKEGEERTPKRGRPKATPKSTPRMKIKTNDASKSGKPLLFTYLNDVAAYCEVSILVTDFMDKIPYGIGYHAELMSESANKPYHILIYGDQDSTRFAEMKINVILEEMTGNFVDSLSLDLSLQPLVAGPDLGNLKYITLQTKTKIFTPDWLPELFSPRSENTSARNLNEIYITGPEFQVLIAKELLRDVIKRTQTLVKDCVISFAKIDLLSLRFQEKLRQIMIEEGSFIQLPFLGAARAVVRVQCTNIQTCNQTISQLMNLISQLYNATFWVHSGEDDGQGHYLQPDIQVDVSILDKISAASSAIITCKKTSFDIIGFKSDTKRAIAMLNSLNIWKVRYHYFFFLFNRLY